MTQDEIIKALRDMAKYPTVTLPRDSEALKAAADLLAQPEQEPVATVISETGANVTMSWWHEPALPVGTKLYTTPPQRTWIGLTDEEIELLNDCGDTDSYKFARAIEAKLKGRNT